MTSHADSLTHEDLQRAKDIVDRLRGTEPTLVTHWGRTVLEGEAAAEIERLRAALAEAREVIEDNSCDCKGICRGDYVGTLYCPRHRATKWLGKNK